jgi:hypothetical protein
MPKRVFELMRIEYGSYLVSSGKGKEAKQGKWEKGGGVQGTKWRVPDRPKAKRPCVWLDLPSEPSEVRVTTTVGSAYLVTTRMPLTLT